MTTPSNAVSNLSRTYYDQLLLGDRLSCRALIERAMLLSRT